MLRLSGVMEENKRQQRSIQRLYIKIGGHQRETDHVECAALGHDFSSSLKPTEFEPDGERSFTRDLSKLEDCASEAAQTGGTQVRWKVRRVAGILGFFRECHTPEQQPVKGGQVLVPQRITGRTGEIGNSGIHVNIRKLRIGRGIAQELIRKENGNPACPCE